MSLFDTTPFHQDSGDSSRCRKQLPRDSIASSSTASSPFWAQSARRKAVKSKPSSTRHGVLLNRAGSLDTIFHYRAVSNPGANLRHRLGFREAEASLRARLFTAAQIKTTKVRFSLTKGFLDHRITSRSRNGWLSLGTWHPARPARLLGARSKGRE